MKGKVWKALCSVHGWVEINQKAKPSSCKRRMAISARCVRDCGHPLREVHLKEEDV